MAEIERGVKVAKPKKRSWASHGRMYLKNDSTAPARMPAGWSDPAVGMNEGNATITRIPMSY